MTALPEEFNAWLSGEPPLRYAIVRSYWLGPSQLAKMASTDDDLIEQLTEYGFPSDEEAVIRLQFYPRKLEASLLSKLPSHVNLHPVVFTDVLYVVQMPSPPVYRWWYAPASTLFQNPFDKGSRQAFCTTDAVSRAAGKIWECIIAAGLSPTDVGNVVDVGAAPGGWTTYLSTQAKRVIAVDPAEMSPKATARDNVVHLQCKVEESLGDIVELLNGEDIDCLVSDVNVPPSRALTIMQPLFQLLKPGGTLILTLKFSGTGNIKTRAVGQIQERLGTEFTELSLLWLFSNTIAERTLICRKKL